jgi:hypothetical protein
MLAVMEFWGSISPARIARRTRQRGAAAARRAGIPASSCVLQVLGLGVPLRQWAEQGWQGRPIAQETASGILIAALGTIAGRLQRPGTSAERQLGARFHVG